ncbi:MAG: HlyD family efflux transporter periplasmic adaptor subunit [Lachnospiraceae bacterium]|nr:HlyD family efflux transporter periplasmic adaptor subunit [Lachnospiraceae bacterium]
MAFKLPNLKELLNKNKKKELEEVASVDAGEGAVSSDSFVKTELSNEDIEATQAAHDEIKNMRLRKQRLIKKIVIIAVAIIAVIFIVRLVLNAKKKQVETAEVMKNVSKARIMNISSEISGSGTLKPKDSYTITSLVEGNVTNVFFNMGDKVVKDQLLITIDSSTAYREIVNATSSVAQAKDTYNQAKYEYEKLLVDYEGRTYKAPYDGSLRTFTVKVGDKLSNNTKIGTLVNDSLMTVKLPFSSNDAKTISIGQTALLELQETGEYLAGTVKSIAEESQVQDSGALVRYVTIVCENPGGLTTNNSAIAVVGTVVSIEDANFELETDEELTFTDGNGVEVEKLLVSEGAIVKKGTPLFLITEDTFNNILSSKKKAYLSAEEALTKAENNYDDAIDKYDEYFITAPIDGTVITKDAKVGDKIQKSTSSAKTLATLYDLSELTFDMDIDELDITNIKEGQEVNVQADAFKNKIFKGVITNVSLVAANSNGVTNYPVTVTITDVGELLPGMNVDAYVILANVENAVAIPADALQRGNVVYVLNSSPTIKSGNYSTEGISDRVKNRAPEGFTAINVETGISNSNFIEIKSGLQEDDEVYVTESTSNSTLNFGGMGGGFGGPPMGGGQRR